MIRFRLILINIAAATVMNFTSCNTVPVAKKEIYAALCVPSNADNLTKIIETNDLVTSADVASVLGKNNLTWIIYSLLVDDPLLSGKYDWELPEDELEPKSLASKLGAYMNENGSLIAEQDAVISIYARDKSSGIILGMLHISTSYGLNARVCYEIEVNGNNIYIREARVPLAGSRDCKSGLVIISNGIAVDRFQVGGDKE